MKRIDLVIVAFAMAVGTIASTARGQTGACCRGDATCISTDSAGCATLGGQFIGAGTSCATTVCTGACCLLTGNCSSSVSRNSCTGSGGVFQGAATTCALNCPATLGTGFTYQGQLKQDDLPVNDTADVRVTMHDRAVGGSPLGTVQRNEVDVLNGRFLVELDFGFAVFEGDSRWLEVAVRVPHDPTNTAPFTTLAPRQSITPVPYAVTALQTPVGHSLDAPDGSPIDAVLVDNDGDVGIGTVPAAGEKLHVAGDARFDGANGIGVRNPNNLSANVRLTWLNDVPRIRWGGSGAGAANGFDFQKIGDVSLLRILDSGNVGIGTTTPARRLHVSGGASGATSFSAAEMVIEDDASSFLHFLSPDATESGVLFGGPTTSISGGIIFNSPTNPEGLAFRSGGNTTRMVLDASGDLGLGTMTPASELHVFDASGTARIRVESAAGQAGISLMSDSTVENVVYSPAGSDDLRFFVNSADRMAVTSAGNVGIGTTSPTGKLHVSGPSNNASVVLPDDSISSAETLEEPGIASDRSSATVEIADDSVTLATSTIAAPTSGHVIAYATAAISKGTITVGDCNIEMEINKTTGTTATGDTYFTRVESQKVGTLAFHSVFAVPAGASTFTLTGRSGFNACHAFNKRLTLLFVPTTYGTTDVD